LAAVGGKVDLVQGGGFENGGLQSLFITRLTNPWTPAALGTIISEPTYAWEKTGNPVNEGPFVLQADEIERGDWFTPAQIDRWIAERPRELAPAFLYLWPLARARLV
jgi:hypothetical protein